MKHTIITRDTKGKIRATSDAEKGDAEIHVYPFKELTIRSHVRPHFVIYQAGLQLDGFFSRKRTLYKFLEEHPVVDQMYKIYEGWSEEIPNNCYDLDPTFRNTFGNAPDPAGFNSAKNTRSKRLDDTQQPDSPTAGKGKQGRVNPQQIDAGRN